MKVAVVGATGMVGAVMIKLLEERQFPLTELIPVASQRSVGKKISYKGVDHTIVGLETAVEMRPDIAIFSAGGDTSLEWAPKFAEAGTTVIDNSSAWRMDPTKKLIVPEINASILTAEDKIIANPNCSTIQLVMALSTLMVGRCFCGCQLPILGRMCVCVCGGGGACQVGFGTWVASQMPNQLDRGMVDSPGKMRCVTCVERSVQLCLS